MDFQIKEKLAFTRMSGLIESGIRIRAARHYAGLSQQELGDVVNLKKATVSNIEKGRAYPTRPLMVYFYRNWRIDINFLVCGEFSQLPSDLQKDLFSLLESLYNGEDL